MVLAQNSTFKKFTLRSLDEKSMPRAVCLYLLVICLAGCDIRRDRPAGEGIHEEGWANMLDGGKHAEWLREANYPIEDCQVCHGTDGQKSPVQLGCDGRGCHEKGVSFCGTCHGSSMGPRPTSGAHDKHPAYCQECHVVPQSLRDAGHLNAAVDVVFSGLALQNNATPTWNGTLKTCSSTYCHVGQTVNWEPATAATTPCDFCHGNPPESHGRFEHVASASTSCVNCHPAADSPSHVNGSIETNELTCAACHGMGPFGAPPTDLDGSTIATSRGVGAHRRHLEETLADRMGKVVRCSVCHTVPTQFSNVGHIDTTIPANVDLILGQYDPIAKRCSTSCHFDVFPGPLWTDDSGAARECDACHGYPPALTRKGTPHTPSSACLSCHTFSAPTHVDGGVDLLP